MRYMLVFRGEATACLAAKVPTQISLASGKAGQPTALTKLGDVNGVECYKITFDISAADLSSSESELCHLIADQFVLLDH